MANMMTDKTHLQKKYRMFQILSILGFLMAFAAWGLHIPLRGMLMPLLPIGVIIGGILNKKAQMIKNGLEGEQHTTNLLSNLPSDVYVFSDLKVQSDGRESEMDSVIVSPSGVFVVETKNHNGKIVGDAENKYWTQHKVGRKGTPYQKEIYSPVKQVGTHVYRLSQYFKENGMNIWVDGAVFFSNYETSVKVKNLNKIPVFSHYESDELLDYVTTKKKKELSEQEVQRIIALLNDVKSA